MDKAPTMPRDKAIFPLITLVITNVIIGSMQIVAVCDVVLIQLWPVISKRYLKDRLIENNNIILNNSGNKKDKNDVIAKIIKLI